MFSLSCTNLVGSSEGGGQEAIRVSICPPHQLKEPEDSMATPTLCPSANPPSKDTKRKRSRFTSSSRAQSLAMANFVPTKMLIMACWGSTIGHSDDENDATDKDDHDVNCWGARTMGTVSL